MHVHPDPRDRGQLTPVLSGTAGTLAVMHCPAPFEDLPHARQVLGTLDFGHDDVAAEWAEVLRAMAATGTACPERTTDAPLGGWFEGAIAAVAPGDDRPIQGAHAAAIAGIALVDLVNADRVDPTTLVGPFSAAAEVVVNLLAPLGRSFPAMTVRAGMGYAMWARRDWVVHRPVDVAEPWVRAGLGESGGLCLAAGVSLDEALARAEQRAAFSEDDLRAMAALRAIPVPAR